MSTTAPADAGPTEEDYICLVALTPKGGCEPSIIIDLPAMQASSQSEAEASATQTLMGGGLIDQVPEGAQFSSLLVRPKSELTCGDGSTTTSSDGTTTVTNADGSTTTTEAPADVDGSANS